MRKKQIQGSMDGLCGIYCLVHFLDSSPRLAKAGRTKAHASFGALLKSAENLGKLTAAHITGGYFAQDLVEIFNETARRKRLPLKAFELHTVAKHLGETSGVSLLRRIFDDYGSAIVAVHAGEHWVLASALGDDQEIIVQDSGHREKYRKNELSKIGRDFDGVALMPHSSKISKECGNAQTH